MLRTKYIVTVDLRNTIHVFRQSLSSASEDDAPPPFHAEFNRDVPECALRLALALLHDCLRNEARARRLQGPLTDLLVSPLLRRVNWILTNEDIEDAVQAIEDREGWFWIEDGYYLDEDPQVASG
jgi:hypothetical protein